MKKVVRGKTPSLIGASNGRPRIITVKKRSKCVRCGSGISAGAECVGIPKLGGGFTRLKRYCKTCYLNILEQTRTDLDKLENLI